MASASDARLDQGPGDGSLRNALDVAIQADLAALFSQEQNRVTVVGAITNATTAGKAKTTATCTYLLNNSGYTKAGTDNLWDLTGLTTGASGYAKVLLQLDSSGAATVKKGTESTVSQAAAAFPAPDANKCVVGWVQLGNSYAGGSVSGLCFDGTPFTSTLQTTA